MITVGMNYQVIEGKEEPFEKKFALVMEVMAADQGHESTQLYRGVFDPQSYLIVSEWNSRKAFDDFVASDTFGKVTNWGKEHILTTRPSHKVYGDDSDVAEVSAEGCPAQ